jgi:hypothetical protein
VTAVPADKTPFQTAATLPKPQDSPPGAVTPSDCLAADSFFALADEIVEALGWPETTPDEREWFAWRLEQAVREWRERALIAEHEIERRGVFDRLFEDARTKRETKQQSDRETLARIGASARSFR